MTAMKGPGSPVSTGEGAMLNRIRRFLVTHKALIFITAVFIYQILSFYFVIAGAGLTDSDDFGGFGAYNKPDFHWKVRSPFMGRFAIQFMDSLVFPHIQYRMGSFAGIMVFTLLGNLISVLALMLVVREVLDIYAALCSGILFFSCAQICNAQQASGFYSWSWSYQLKMFFFMMSLYFLIRYFKDEGKRLRWPGLSALFYVLACMTYETFVPLILVLLLAAIYGLYVVKDLNIKGFMRIAPFYIAGFLFFLIMYYISVLHMKRVPEDSSVMKVVNDFASDERVFTLADYIKENFIVAFALIPGAQCGKLTAVTSMSELLKYDFESVFAAAVTGAAFVLSLLKARVAAFGKLFAYLVICFAGIVLSSTVWVFSNQGYNLMAYQTVNYSRTSYFSYYFICAFITVILLMLLGIKAPAVKIIVPAAVFLSSVYLIVCTLEHNRVWAEYAFSDTHSRVLVYARFFQTEEFQSLPEGANIYLDGEYETVFASGWSRLYCEKERNFFWKEEAVDLSELTYFLHYSSDTRSVYFGLVGPGFKTDDIYVTSMEDLRDYGFNVSRIGEAEGTLTLNYEQEKDYCRENVVYSLHTMPWFIDEGHYADIRATGMDWYSFGLIRGELMNSLRENPGSSRYHGWEE